MNNNKLLDTFTELRKATLSELFYELEVNMVKGFDDFSEDFCINIEKYTYIKKRFLE